LIFFTSRTALWCLATKVCCLCCAGDDMFLNCVWDFLGPLEGAGFWWFGGG